MKTFYSVCWFGIGLLLSSLAGCTPKAAKGNGAAAQVPGFKETGYPVMTEPWTLRVFDMRRHQDTPSFDTLEIFQKLEEKTGVTVAWEYAGADWSTQKPLLLASGDLPDAFFSRALTESDVINNTELFVPLDDLIQRYAPNIQAMFKDDPVMERVARAADGKIYGLPAKMPHRPQSSGVWGINADWLDKLGLPMPTTTEELYTVLKAFKERDPNGNGLADEIPASFLGDVTDSNRGLANFMCPFGIVPTGGWYSVKNGKVLFIAVETGYKDAVAYLHRLYREGLLDQELFTQNRNVLAAKANPPKGQSEIVGLSGQWSRMTHFGVDRVEHYPLVMPLKGPNGDQYWNTSSSLAVTKYMFEITRDCKHPEIAMRWIDAIYDQTTSLEMFFGPEGKTWTANADGTYTWLQQPEGFTGNWGWNFGLNDQAPGYTPDAVSRKFICQNAAEEQQYQDKLLLEPYYPDEAFPLLAFTLDETNELAILKTDVESVTQQKFAEWINQGGIEQEYDGFVKQLNKMGLPRLLELYQGAYDRYMGVVK